MSRSDANPDADPREHGPGADLVAQRTDHGAHHVTIALRSDLVGHKALSRFEPVRSWLEEPGVPAIAPLLAWDAHSGEASYRVREGVSVAALIARGPAGVRAGLELMAAGARALGNAVQRACSEGLTNHGALSPWRLWVDTRGQVLLLGYGLPPVEAFAYLDEDTDDADGRTFRYSPPERIEDLEEDLRSDLYALALISVELITGEPVYEGDADKVVDQILAGHGPNCVEDLGEGWSDALLDLLCIAVELKPADRYPDHREVLGLIEGLLKDAPGQPLSALISASGADRATATPLSEAPTAPPPTPEVPPAPTTAAPAQAASAPVTSRPAAATSAPAQAVAPTTSVTASTSAPADSIAPPHPSEQLPPPLASLALDASIEQARVQAGALIERAERVAAHAAQSATQAALDATRCHTHPTAIVAEAAAAAARAAKCVQTVRSSARLVDLDDEIEDARDSLELVRGASTQVDNSARTALAALHRVQDVLAAEFAENEALEASRSQASDYAERAVSSADSAEAVCSQLQSDADQGLLGDASAQLRIALAAQAAAAEAADEADDAAEDAELAHSAEVASEAVAEARACYERASKALSSVQQADVEARRAAEEALTTARDATTRAAEEAGHAASSAQQAFARAKQALEQGPSSKGRKLLRQAEGAQQEASAHAATALTAVSQAEATALATDAALAASSAAEAARAAVRSASTTADLSDQIVALAGEAAAQAADLSKAVTEAQSYADKSSQAVSRARQAVDALLDQTVDLTGPEALTARADAVGAVDRAERIALRITAATEEASALLTPEAIAPILATLSDQLDAVREASELAIEHTRHAHEAAVRELEQLEQQQILQAALDQAAARASQAADLCRAHVDDAWARYHALATLIDDTTVDQARSLRDGAFELIDIAEYQAGEARTAADHAAQQRDPDEANDYAKTAESFAERISADLPDALASLSEAEEMASREVQGLRSARDHTANAVHTTEAARDAIADHIASGTSLAKAWPQDRAISTALRRLRSCNEGIEGDLNEVSYARDRAREAGRAAETVEIVPQAQAAAARATEKKAQAEVCLAALKKAVNAAEHAKHALAEAQARTLEAEGRVAAVVVAIQSAAAGLEAAIATHQASGPEVTDAHAQIQAAARAADTSAERVKAAIAGAESADTAASAEGFAKVASMATRNAEAAQEAATEAESAGIAAATREASERAATAARHVARAKELAIEHARKARASAVQTRVSLAEAAPELGAGAAPAARALFKQAEVLAAAAWASAERAERHASECERTTGDAVFKQEQAAERVADEVVSAAEQAEGLLRRAVDTARQSAAEAEALAGIKAEAASLLGRKSATLNTLGQARQRLTGLLAQSTQAALQALDTRAADHNRHAQRALQKLEAAAAMATDAEALGVATKVLKTMRRAMGQAQEALEAIEGLVEQAKQALEQEQEAAARALAEARARAQDPAHEARAAARKTSDWFELALQDASASDSDAVHAALGTLHGHVQRAEASALAAEQLAAGLQDADADAVAQIGGQVRAAADAALASAQGAREARELLRTALSAEEAENEAIEAATLVAAEHAAEAEQLVGPALAEVDHLLAQSRAVEGESDTLSALQATIEGLRVSIPAAAAAAVSATEAAICAETQAQAEASAQQANSQLQQLRQAKEQISELDKQLRSEQARLQEAAAEATKAAAKAAREEAHRARFEKARRTAQEKRSRTNMRELRRGRTATPKDESSESGAPAVVDPANAKADQGDGSSADTDEGRRRGRRRRRRVDTAEVGAHEVPVRPSGRGAARPPRRQLRRRDASQVTSDEPRATRGRRSRGPTPQAPTPAKRDLRSLRRRGRGSATGAGPTPSPPSPPDPVAEVAEPIEFEPVPLESPPPAVTPPPATTTPPPVLPEADTSQVSAAEPPASATSGPHASPIERLQRSLRRSTSKQRPRRSVGKSDLLTSGQSPTHSSGERPRSSSGERPRSTTSGKRPRSTTSGSRRRSPPPPKPDVDTGALGAVAPPPAPKSPRATRTTKGKTPAPPAGAPTPNTSPPPAPPSAPPPPDPAPTVSPPPPDPTASKLPNARPPRRRATRGKGADDLLARMRNHKK